MIRSAVGPVWKDGTKFDGWTLQEAFQRCVDPHVLARREAATEAWREAGAPTRFVRLMGPAPRVSRDHGRHLYLQMRAATAEATISFRRLLHERRLISWGRRESPIADHAPIPASAWSGLSFHHWQRSVVVEDTVAKTKIFDIKVYPVLEAPDVVDHLDGKTLLEACRDHVLHDPEVAAARSAATSALGNPASFGFAWPPYRAVWPVGYSPLSTEGGPIGCLKGDDESDSSSRLTAVADELLRSRFARLIEYLASGTIVAFGSSRRGGASAPVPRAYWQRRSTYIDLENGDLLERSPHARDHTTALSAPTFRGLVLGAPDAEMAPQSADRQRRIVYQMRRQPPNIQTAPLTYNACLEWLISEMQKSLRERRKPKDDWWKDAQKRWPKKLSHRAFDRAWAAANETTGAVWSYPGAPRKTAHKKSPR